MKCNAVMLALFAVLQLTTPVADASPQILVGESEAVSVGSNVVVRILVSGVEDLLAFQFDLRYDDTVLELLGFRDQGTDFELAAMAGGGTLTGLTGFALPGLLSGVADSISGAAEGLSGSGSLVEIEFRALARGVSSLTVSDAFLDFAPIGPESIVNGAVVVPEPTSAWLVIAALGALRSRRAWLLGEQARRRGLARPVWPIASPMPVTQANQVRST